MLQKIVTNITNLYKSRKLEKFKNVSLKYIPMIGNIIAWFLMMVHIIFKDYNEQISNKWKEAGCPWRIIERGSRILRGDIAFW